MSAICHNNSVNLLTIFMENNTILPRPLESVRALLIVPPLSAIISPVAYDTSMYVNTWSFKLDFVLKFFEVVQGVAANNDRFEKVGQFSGFFSLVDRGLPG